VILFARESWWNRSYKDSQLDELRPTFQLNISNFLLVQMSSDRPLRFSHLIAVTFRHVVQIQTERYFDWDSLKSHLKLTQKTHLNEPFHLVRTHLSIFSYFVHKIKHNLIYIRMEILCSKKHLSLWYYGGVHKSKGKSKASKWSQLEWIYDDKTYLWDRHWTKGHILIGRTVT